MLEIRLDGRIVTMSKKIKANSPDIVSPSPDRQTPCNPMPALTAAFLSPIVYPSPRFHFPDLPCPLRQSAPRWAFPNCPNKSSLKEPRPREITPPTTEGNGAGLAGLYPRGPLGWVVPLPPGTNLPMLPPCLSVRARFPPPRRAAVWGLDNGSVRLRLAARTLSVSNAKEQERRAPLPPCFL